MTQIQWLYISVINTSVMMGRTVCNIFLEEGFSFWSAPRECVSQRVFIVSLYILLTKGHLRMYQKSDCIPLTRFIVSVIGMFNQLFHAIGLYFRCDYGEERLKKIKIKFWSNINKGLQIFSSRWIFLQHFVLIVYWLMSAP